MLLSPEVDTHLYPTPLLNEIQGCSLFYLPIVWC